MRCSERRRAIALWLQFTCPAGRVADICLVRPYECVFDIFRFLATVIIGKMTFEFPISAAASLLVGVALLIAACSRPGSTTGSSALKPIDQTALQTMVDRTAKELLNAG